ncbi:multiple sugar transport system permease protein [Paenibacillus algorifonticola]|uniref:Multiple sugar transport system permease protein n=1 Tax=Paenibacillus algorifonticola TaxID=684063 RepID=A0A1I2G948_9BACL|nr:sugar ABC transporter permease [Paenibacillus algorifonticola]SFF14234.1 multiple sugar transport system permease protein [Paenibacillus algorifonticola]
MRKLYHTSLPYLMIFPNVFIYVVFILLPLVWVCYLSLTDYNVLSPGKWVGLENYTMMLADDIYLKAVRNTIFYWVGTTLPTMFLGLLIAVLLNSKIRGLAVFRAAVYLPGIMSSIAVALTWLWLLNPTQGPINHFLDWIGLPSLDWLQNMKAALPAVTVVGTWMGVGFAMIIYLSGLQGIPDHLYEAASIDGAAGVRKFVSITIPMLKPVTFFLFVTVTIRSFQVFDLVYVLTGGGPVNSTTTIVNEVFKAGFQEYRMGYASSLAISLLLITMLITLINYKFGSKQDA